VSFILSMPAFESFKYWTICGDFVIYEIDFVIVLSIFFIASSRLSWRYHRRILSGIILACSRFKREPLVYNLEFTAINDITFRFTTSSSYSASDDICVFYIFIFIFFQVES